MGSRKRKLTPNEIEWQNGQICSYVCGIDGCEFTFHGRYDAWMEVRQTHRREKHPGFRERKRRVHTIPSINKGTLRYMNEKEMKAWEAAA